MTTTPDEDSDSDHDVRAIVGALADGDRRHVLGAVELGASSLDLVVAASGLPQHRAARALGRLVDAGLVVNGPDSGLAVDAELFTRTARAMLSRPPSDEHAGESPGRRKVLDAFVRNGRITSMPAAPMKRRVLLDWIAGRFEVGRRYSETEVNELLDGHAEDHVSLRRALVDGGFLDRAGGDYWRVGGTVG